MERLSFFFAPSSVIAAGRKSIVAAQKNDKTFFLTYFGKREIAAFSCLESIIS